MKLEGGPSRRTALLKGSARMVGAISSTIFFEEGRVVQSSIGAQARSVRSAGKADDASLLSILSAVGEGHVSSADFSLRINRRPMAS